MTIAPLMITAKDDELLGIANRSDPMGVLALWSLRARDLVPHLTEQTTDVRGFQLLAETFRLWEFYEPAHPRHAGRLSDFFMLVEQAFARTVGNLLQQWPLPGTRRVNARMHEAPHISLEDGDWHLLNGQLANGLWGLYRGASRRAGLLNEEMTRLSAETMEQALSHRGLGEVAQRRLFAAVAEAMDGATVELPTHLNNQLPRDLCATFEELPLAGHLQERLVEAFDLNRRLATRLRRNVGINRRSLLTTAARELTAHRVPLENAIRCEDLLSVVESVFLCLCASKGMTVDAAVADLPVDLEALETARAGFGDSGSYGGATAGGRHARFYEQLDTSNAVSLARSVLRLHTHVSEGRGRAAWVWEEHGVLHTDVEVEPPTEADLQTGVAWRNDYYLYPLKRIADQLAEAQQ
jgi:hypothetical protein